MNGWTLFAWQGIRLKVPADWEMGGADGDARNGHCRLDDADYARLDIRWQPGRSSSTASSVATAYIRKARLDRREVQLRRDVRLVSVPGMDTEFFLVKGERDSMHMAACCSVCGRVALLRAVYDPDEKFRPVLQEMFASWCDHPVEGRVPWAAYNFRFDMPEAWRLFDHTVRAGRLQFEFRARNRIAHTVRSSLADIWLKKKGLRDWVQADKVLGPDKLKAEFAEAEWQGHPALLWTSRERRSLRRWLLRGRLIRGLAWHCPEANSLVAVRWQGPDAVAQEADDLAGTVRCHEDGERSF